MHSLETLFPKAHIAVFAGAGISRNSGIPTVQGLVDRILGNTFLTSKDMMLFRAKNYPFEAFIETISSEVSINKLLEVFASYSPNHAHKFIATLAKKKIVSLVITTNFDTLIEQACKEQRVNFISVFTGSELEKFDISGKKELCILKLHGSLESKANLAVTLKKVTSRRNVLSIKNALLNLFHKGQHNYIVFAGYSCSDHFDISPIIANASNSPKYILFNSFANKFKIEDLSNHQCFPGYKKGTFLSYNTDRLVERFWKKCSHTPFKKITLDVSKAYDSVDLWAKETLLTQNGFFGLIVSGKILASVGYYSHALRYYEKADRVLVKMKDDDVTKKAIIYSRSGQAYRQTGKYEMALKCFNKALLIWKELRNRNKYAKCLSDIGTTWRLAKNLELSKVFHKRALAIFVVLKNYREVYNTEICIGNLYIDLNKNKYAERHFNKAKPLLRTDKIGGTILLNSLAAVNIRMKHFMAAERYLIKAELVANKIDIPRISAVVEANWGTYYSKQKNYPKALEKYTEALKILPKKGDFFQRFSLLKNRVETNLNLGEKKAAVVDIRECLSMVKRKKHPERKLLQKQLFIATRH